MMVILLFCAFLLNILDSGFCFEGEAPQSLVAHRFTRAQRDHSHQLPLLVGKSLSTSNSSGDVIPESAAFFNCPIWSYFNGTEGICQCPKIPHGIVNCDQFGKLSVLDCHCVTYNKEKGTIEAGFCDYNCVQYTGKRLVDDVYHPLSLDVMRWNNMTCGRTNRNGTLCGQCEDGFYPRAYSYDISCMNCAGGNSNSWKYLLSAFLPLTVFYFLVLLFSFNIHSSELQGYITYSQAISLPVLLRNLYRATQNQPVQFQIIKYLVSLYGIWNLDFFRAYNPGICLQKHTLTTLSLDLAVGLYPLLLMVITYSLITLYDYNLRLLVIAWKPFKAFFGLYTRNWDIRTSIVDSFSTFFLLSNVKILSVSFDLLIPIRVYSIETPTTENTTVNSSMRLYYDASVSYFGPEHNNFATVGFVMIFLFVFLPTCLLMSYPFAFCHKCLNLLPRRGQIFLHIFVDSFQGCYKNGTEPGTRDFRWFSSQFLIVRFALFSLYAVTLGALFFPYAAMVLVITAGMVIITNPFKNVSLSYNLVIFYLLLACFYASMCAIDIAEVKYVSLSLIFRYSLAASFGTVPHLYFSYIILKKIIQKRKFRFNPIGRIRAWRQGYAELQG